MLFCLYIAILCINFYCIVRGKNNRVILLISFVFLMVMMGCNTYTSDYPGYEKYYNTNEFPGSFEIGYKLIAKVLHFFGFSYQQFLFFYELFGILIGYVSVRRVTDNYHYVVLLYLMTAVFMDTNEVRQFLAYMFVALALTYLSEKKLLCYEFIIILACMFHISALPFVLLPAFIRFMDGQKSMMEVYLLLLCVSCVLIFINGNEIPGLYEIMQVFLDESKLQAYFTTKVNFGFILFFFGHFINILLTYWSLNVLKCLDDMREEIVRYGNIVFAFVMYTSFAMPLNMLNSEFLRYFRFNIFPIIILIAAIMEKKRSLICKRNNIVFVQYDVSILTLLFSYSIVFQHYRVMVEVFENNLINLK